MGSKISTQQPSHVHHPPYDGSRYPPRFRIHFIQYVRNSYLVRRSYGTSAVVHIPRPVNTVIRYVPCPMVIVDAPSKILGLRDNRRLR